jgi:hypothetical protein
MDSSYYNEKISDGTLDLHFFVTKGKIRIEMK